MFLDTMRWTWFFVTVKHAGQTYCGMPYTHHLADVYGQIVRFGYQDDEVIAVASVLHDVVEDTDTKLKEIREMFGDEVADIVGRVTNEPGENRKVRSALTYPKIRGNPKAVIVKLADRIANVSRGGSLVEMYKKEYEDFRRALYTPGQCDEMWVCLDGLMGYNKGGN